MSQYTAIVKDIPTGTIASDKDWEDKFAETMRCFVGMRIRVEKLRTTTDWFFGVNNPYTYHASWLEDLRDVDDD